MIAVNIFFRDSRIRSSRLLGHIALILVMFMAFASPIESQIVEGWTGDPTIDELLRGVERGLRDFAEKDGALLRSVVATFRASAGPDTELARLLDDLELKSLPSEILGANPADASASYGELGAPHIKVTQALMFRIREKSDVAARRMIAELSHISEELVRDDLVDSLSFELNGNVLGWMIGHEVAHHRLGHICKPPKKPDDCRPTSLAHSRQLELEADRLAFEIMNRAGFSLFLLSQYFEIMEALEAVQVRAGIANPEGKSSHPSRATRVRSLKTFMKNHRPIDQQWVMYSAFVQWDRSSEFVKISLFYHPDPKLHLGFILTNNGKMQMAGIEQEPGGQLYFYDRDNERVHFLATPFDYATPGAIKLLRSAADGNSFSHLFFRDSMVGTTLEPTGLIYSTLNMDPMAIQLRPIRKLAKNASQLKTATALLESANEEAYDVILEYFKGLISERQLQTKLRSLILEFRPKFDGVLGPGAFDELGRMGLEPIPEVQKLQQLVQGDEWVEFAPADEDFSVAMPGMVFETTESVDSSAYTLERGDATYLVGVFGKNIPLDGGSLDKFRDDTVASLAGTLISEKNISLGGHPGKALRIEFESAGGSRLSDVHIYFVRGRLYELVFIRPKDVPMDDAADTFFNSFRLSEP